jgi:hypothetical protein
VVIPGRMKNPSPTLAAGGTKLIGIGTDVRKPITVPVTVPRHSVQSMKTILPVRVRVRVKGGDDCTNVPVPISTITVVVRVTVGLRC